MSAPSTCKFGRIRIYSSFVLLCSILFCGCAVIRPLFAPEPLPVLSMNNPDERVTIRQRITMTYGDRTFSFQSVVELHEDQMVVAGLSSYSTTLFTIRIQDGTVHVNKQADIPFDLTRLATDLQWSLWPQIPEQTGYSVVEEETEDEFQRRIFRNGSLAGTVYAQKRPPWSGDVRFNHPDGYTIQMKLISTSALSKQNDK